MARRRLNRVWMRLAMVTPLLAGCTSQAHDAADGGGDAAADSPLDSDGANPDAAGRLVWTASSLAIDLQCFGFFQGSMAFAATRNQLSTDELGLLDQLRTGNPGQAATDLTTCNVNITDMDGTIASYLAVENDGAQDPKVRLIAFATFGPFLRSLPCLFAQDSGFGHPLAPDRRCLNGIFIVPREGGTLGVDRALSVPAPGLRHLELEDCDGATQAGKLTLQLLAAGDADAGSAVPLAEGMPLPAHTSEGTCLIIDHDFATPGTYVMRVIADPSLTPVGDYAFRYF